jgi:hypothetical protein
MFCPCGYKFSTSVTQEMVCPLCGTVALVRNQKDQGRYAWFLLHNEADPNKEWYTEIWLPQVPKYGCKCMEHWRQITHENPPDFASAEAFWVWGVHRHNDVNRRLGKREWLITSDGDLRPM